jgi:hypothetical protein
MRDEVLIQRVVLGDQDGERPGPSPPGAPSLLPHRRTSSWVPGQHGRVQGSDVDAELQRRGGGHGEQLAVREGSLEGSPLLWQVPRSVHLDAVAEHARKLSADDLSEQLRGPPGASERDGPKLLFDELLQDLRGFGHRALPRSRLLVEERGVPQGEQLLAARGGILGDLFEGKSGESLGELAGIADGRGSQDEPRIAPVPCHDPAQPAQDEGDVRAEHSPGHVGLVEDHH